MTHSDRLDLVVRFAPLLLVASCNWIAGLDDAVLRPDGTQQPVCSTQGLTCSGSAMAQECNNRCLVSCSDAVNETTAAMRCSQWHGKLAPLRDAASNHCIRDTVFMTGDVWIGLEQSATATMVDTNWSWNSDGLALTFTAWTTGQPDDMDMTENGQEQCAFMPNATETWSDTSCTRTLPFVCNGQLND